MDINKGVTNDSCAYWHLGRKAASMIAPEACSHLPLNLPSVIDVSMVTGSLSSGPLKVSFVSVLHDASNHK